MDKEVVWRVLSEWDIGLEDVVFRSRQDAMEAAREAMKDSDLDDDFENAMEAGLLGFDPIELK